MKLAKLSILAVLAIASHTAFAQSSGSPDPRSMSGSGSSSGSSTAGSTAGGATDASAVTNVGSAFTSETTTETVTTPTADIYTTGEMANTGGEPELMLLAGVLLATGGLFLRRKAGAFSL